MKASELANRYAKALFEIAQESGAEQQYHNELQAVTDVMSQDEGVATFAASPMVRAADKEAVLSKAIQGQQLSDKLKSFLYLLARKDRLAILPEILTAYRHQTDQRAGVERGEVTTTAALDQASKEEITQLLAKLLNKKVVLEFKVDPELVGGLVAHVGSLTIDDSIQAHLKSMREELKRRMH